MEPDEVESIIAAAWQAVEKAGVSETAQEAAFLAALQLLTKGQISTPGALTPAPGAGVGQQQGEGDQDDGGDAGVGGGEVAASSARRLRALQLRPRGVSR